MHIVYTSSKGRSRCFVFLTECLEVAKFLNRQNQSVQKTPLICMSNLHTFAPMLRYSNSSANVIQKRGTKKFFNKKLKNFTCILPTNYQLCFRTLFMKINRKRQRLLGTTIRAASPFTVYYLLILKQVQITLRACTHLHSYPIPHE